MKTLNRITPLLEKSGLAMLFVSLCAVIAWAAAPTVINSTDLISNSRTTINNNFSNLYAGSSGLIDCSGVAGRFVVTLNGGGTLPVCGTLTWANITALYGYPGVVTTWNGRANAVTLTAADVAGVEQDLRISASPTFAGGTFTAGGVTATNSGGYAYTATQSTGGGFYYTGSGTIYGGVTTGHTAAAFTTTDGSCTMRGDTGLSCSGTQAVLATSSPTFAGITLTPTVYASLPSCATGTKGTIGQITDGSVNTWGSTVAGSGSYNVTVVCDGTNYTVIGK